jgi:hypothetical protein
MEQQWASHVVAVVFEEHRRFPRTTNAMNNKVDRKQMFRALLFLSQFDEHRVQRLGNVSIVSVRNLNDTRDIRQVIHLEQNTNNTCTRPTKNNTEFTC